MIGKITYKLSNEADNYLESIFDYTTTHYNLKKAIAYLTEISNLFEQLCKHPYLGRARMEIFKDIYSISFHEHIVFYEVKKHQIIIVRVLHRRSDMPKHF